MKNNLKHKIILLFIIINVVFIASIIFYIYKDSQYDNQVHKRYNKDELIETTMLRSTLLLADYHKRIFSGEYIDPQSYLEIVRNLSFFVNKSMLLSVESYIYKNKQFILTASSASQEDFEAKRYPSYEKINQEDAKFLSKIYNSQSFFEEYQDGKVAMSFELNNIKYIILATIAKRTPLQSFNHIYTFVLVGIILLLLLGLLIRYTLLPLLKEIKEIDRVLNTFFNYLLNPRDKSTIEYIKNVSHYELLSLSDNINSNIKAVVEKMNRDSQNHAKDTVVLKEMIQALTPTHQGYFLQEVNKKAHSSEINKLRDVINGSMQRMDGVLAKIDASAKSYLKQNYTLSIEPDKYEDKVLAIIESINALGDKQSKYFLDQIAYLIGINNNIKKVDEYIYNNAYMLDDLLPTMKDILNAIEGDHKFAFEFDNIIQLVKQENLYLNDLLKQFTQKYLESIALVNDFRDGIFDNDANELLARFNAVVKDSSVRDKVAQEELIEKIRNLITIDTPEIDDQKVTELMTLLIQELIKDILYSLDLIEQKVEKLADHSSTRVSSYATMQNGADEMKRQILATINQSQSIEKVIKKISNQTNDLKYGIVDDNHFKESDRAHELLNQKGESDV